jgi:FixJ family two-component response regulator
MPGMSGRELAGRLVNLQPDIRVLFMSGYTGRTRTWTRGDAELHPKPFSPEALTRNVRKALDHEVGG